MSTSVVSRTTEHHAHRPVDHHQRRQPSPHCSTIALLLLLPGVAVSRSRSAPSHLYISHRCVATVASRIRAPSPPHSLVARSISCVLTAAFTQGALTGIFSICVDLNDPFRGSFRITQSAAQLCAPPPTRHAPATHPPPTLHPPALLASRLGTRSAI